VLLVVVAEANVSPLVDLPQPPLLVAFERPPDSLVMLQPNKPLPGLLPATEKARLLLATW
jgi:hypothetical protein